ncbi:S8 family peptidase [Gaopeijia maritima]|uniref:S8 family peptidase n=1 Tax=Gaopeijia maritima TaxID=3119007 RepID=UPI0032441B1B
MTSRRGLLPLVLLLGACTASAPPAAPAAPEPAPPAEPPRTSQPAPAPPTSAEVAVDAPLAAAPDAWQLLDLEADRVPGTSATRAWTELLAGREPARTVVVAVIDGGVDTAHVDLRDVLWRNEGEVAGNGADDDDNGYVDDLYGWNFIGGADGRNVEHETLEVTRLHAACLADRPTPGHDCAEIATAYAEASQENAEMLAQLEQVNQVVEAIVPILSGALGGEDPTEERVRGLMPTTPQIGQARQVYLQLADLGATPSDISDAVASYRGRAEYGLNLDFDPRDIVGDDPSDGEERVYGNADVMGPDADHGTHVAGIIGAVRGNGVGIDGMAAPVRLMTLRAVPDGDERDKDVANAIRYAVDNGAHVINMSFGKSFSPRKELVDAAVRYADERGVLMVHAAGNDGADVDVESNFPSPSYADGGRAAHWITVGASNWAVDSLAAPFSNYGRTEVDLFAPGAAILSTLPGDTFDRQDGTSMAAPTVTGAAAVLMAWFPELDAAEVKRILMETAVRFDDAVVPRPGDGEAVPFGTLSVTGGVVNLYEAVRAALSGN